MEDLISLVIDGKDVLCVTNLLFGKNYIVVHTFGEDLDSWKRNRFTVGRKYSIKLKTNGMITRIVHDKKFILKKYENNIKESKEDLVPLYCKYFFQIVD